jgi:hypothetical protein
MKRKEQLMESLEQLESEKQSRKHERTKSNQYLDLASPPRFSSFEERRFSIVENSSRMKKKLSKQMKPSEISVHQIEETPLDLVTLAKGFNIPEEIPVFSDYKAEENFVKKEVFFLLFPSLMWKMTI